MVRVFKLILAAFTLIVIFTFSKNQSSPLFTRKVSSINERLEVSDCKTLINFLITNVNQDEMNKADPLNAFTDNKFDGIDEKEVEMIADYFKKKPGFIVIRNFNQDAFKMAKLHPDLYITKPMSAKAIKSTNGFYFFDPNNVKITDLLESDHQYSIKKIILNNKKRFVITYQDKILVSDPDPVFIGWQNRKNYDEKFFFNSKMGYVNTFQKNHLLSLNKIFNYKCIQHGPQSNILMTITQEQFPMAAYTSNGLKILHDEYDLRFFLKEMDQLNFHY